MFGLTLVAVVSVASASQVIEDCQSKVTSWVPEWIEDCQEKCEYYGTDGLPWCPGAEADSNTLLHCVVSLHPYQCQGGENVVATEPVLVPNPVAPSTPAPSSTTTPAPTTTTTPPAVVTEQPVVDGNVLEYCQVHLGSPGNELYDADCKEKCEWYLQNGEPWCGVMASGVTLVECVMKYQPYCIQL